MVEEHVYKGKTATRGRGHRLDGEGIGSRLRKATR